jgi:hypothetical protein
MSNETNEENWAARERLRRVEFWLWWRGWVGRGDLLEGFGISPAQASGDLQRYAEVNPGVMIYQTSRKRYEALEGMRCVLHEPSLDEAMAVLSGWVWKAWGGGGVGGGRVGGEGIFDRLELPTRRVDLEICRRVVVALMGGRRLRLRYHTLSTGKHEWRVLRPGALAWDGRRWHLRAWCETRQEWRDFVLGRISEADWPEEGTVEVPRDSDWEEREKVVLRINPALDEDRKASLRMDYGMEGDELVVEVRRAMKIYLLEEMYIRVGDGHELPRHFVMGGGVG